VHYEKGSEWVLASATSGEGDWLAAVYDMFTTLYVGYDANERYDI
jgi:hypothetical protein